MLLDAVTSQGHSIIDLVIASLITLTPSGQTEIYRLKLLVLPSDFLALHVL
jgi:hypothetical protein